MGLVPMSPKTMPSVPNASRATLPDCSVWSLTGWRRYISCGARMRSFTGPMYRSRHHSGPSRSLRRSDLSDRAGEPEGACGRPLAVGREELVGRVFDRRCDHERVRQAQLSVPRTKRCGRARNTTIEIDDLDRQPVDKVVNH